MISEHDPTIGYETPSSLCRTPRASRYTPAALSRRADHGICARASFHAASTGGGWVVGGFDRGKIERDALRCVSRLV
jgi:hypothetical protein